MRRYFFLLVLILVFSKVYSNDVPGYIVTLNNDTISVQIKVSRGFFFGIGKYNVYKKVEITDSSGNTKELTPKDINAYGYFYKSKDYVYRTKPIKEGDLYFLEPVVVGAKTSLYQYTEIVSQGQNLSTTHEFYTFEKSDGTYLFLTNFAGLETFKEKLKNFYKDNLVVQQLIDSKFDTRRRIQRDIKEILEAVNRS